MKTFYRKEIYRRIICNIFLGLMTILFVQPAAAQATKDTVLLENPNYFMNVFKGGNELFRQGARVQLQEWANPKLRDSIWKHMNGAAFSDAATYSKKANKKKEVRLHPGHYKLIGATEIYTFAINQNGQLNGTLKLKRKPSGTSDKQRETFLQIKNGKPLWLTVKVDGRRRASMRFYENTVMIKQFFKEGGLAKVDSIQKTTNGERPKRLLHIEYDADGKIKVKEAAGE